jgi:hypothetical protein
MLPSIPIPMHESFRCPAVFERTSHELSNTRLSFVPISGLHTQSRPHIRDARIPFAINSSNIPTNKHASTLGLRYDRFEHARTQKQIPSHTPISLIRHPRAPIIATIARHAYRAILNMQSQAKTQKEAQGHDTSPTNPDLFRPSPAPSQKVVISLLKSGFPKISERISVR